MVAAQRQVRNHVHLRDGSLLPFKPGQLWVVLLDRKRPATITPLTKPKVAKPAPLADAVADLASPPGRPPSPAPPASRSSRVHARVRRARLLGWHRRDAPGRPR